MLAVVTIFENNLDVGKAVQATDFQEAYAIAAEMLKDIKGGVDATKYERLELENDNHCLWTGGEPGKAVAVQIIEVE